MIVEFEGFTEGVVSFSSLRSQAPAYERKWYAGKHAADRRTPAERERAIQRYERLAALGLPLFGGEDWGA
jgi:hypothetical protein